MLSGKNGKLHDRQRRNKEKGKIEYLVNLTPERYLFCRARRGTSDEWVKYAGQLRKK